MEFFNLNDLPKGIELIKLIPIEKIQFDENLMYTLCRLITETKDNKLRDIIAIKLADISNPKVIPFLIEALHKLKKSKFNSTLIYACSEYDCGKDINLFVDIILENEDVSFLDSIYVIKAIENPITKSDKNIALKKIEKYLQEGEETEKKANVRDCKKIIESINTK